MATVEQTGKALAKPAEQKSLRELIELSSKELGKALPDHMRPERLVRIALTSIRKNPKLATCTQESFLGALFTAAELGIEPIAGRAYLIPFRNNRKIDVSGKSEWRSFQEVEFVIGYKGVVELFYRHANAVKLSWATVHANDEFEYELGTDAFLHHKPPVKGPRGEIIGYWVCAELKNGGKSFHYMTRDEVLEHGRKHSKTWITTEYDKQQRKKVPCTPHWDPESPWVTDEEAMCLKTVFLQLAKVLPLSFELQQALVQDETSRDFRRGISALDQPTTTDWSKDAPVDTTTETAPPEKPADPNDPGEPPEEQPNASKGPDIPFGK